MSEERIIRINKVLRELNISLERDENSAINMKLLGSSSLSLDKLVSLKGNNKLYTFEYNL